MTPTPPTPPTPPAGTAATPPPPPPRRGLSRNVIVALVVVMALVVAAVVVAVVVATGGGDDDTAGKKKEVFTEPISSTRNPFSPPVGQDSSNVTPVQQGGNTTQTGGQQGLYGGTLQQGTCDKTQLVTFLQQNPDKGRAWAGTLGITPDQISTYVNRLTPVILRSDTRLTNHGFKNGRATSFQTVLQAGTAVLVDEKGAVVTKCYCGNPLTEPLSYPPVYFGPRWNGFSSNNLTIIRQNTTTINIFILIDVRTSEPFQRPAGTDGTQDTPGTGTPQPPATTTPPTTAPPTTAPPRTTQPQGPSPEDQAKAKLNQGSTQCRPFPAPIEDSTSIDVSTQPSSAPNSFLLQAVTRTTSGGTQTFQWNVNRSTIAFTPINELARAASVHCPLLR
jgi:hypothetical protein